MSGYPAGGRQVADEVKALMDALLVEENRALLAVDAGIRGIGINITDVLLTYANGTRARIRAKAGKLVPTPELVLTTIAPAISQFFATSREQVLPVIARQLRACQRAIGPHAFAVAGAGVGAAQDLAPDLEGRYYAAACAAIGAQTAFVGGRMLEQLKVWSLHPEETAADLARRWTSEDPVRLPSAPGRGMIWALRSQIAHEARVNSVALVNGLLLAGYRGWNEAAVAS